MATRTDYAAKPSVFKSKLSSPFTKSQPRRSNRSRGGSRQATNRRTTTERAAIPNWYLLVGGLVGGILWLLFTPSSSSAERENTTPTESEPPREAAIPVTRLDLLHLPKVVAPVTPISDPIRSAILTSTPPTPTAPIETVPPEPPTPLVNESRNGILIALPEQRLTLPKNELPAAKVTPPNTATVALPASVEPPVTAPPSEPERLKYGFYDLLPQMEVVIPDDELNRATSQIGNNRDLLQVASFRNREEAERLEANLLLLNFQPKIESATSPTGTLNQVRVGPFNERRKLDRAKRLLQENGYNPIVIKGR